MAGPNDFTSSFASGLAATAPKSATPTEIKTFTTGVDKAQADFNKSLKDAKSTLAQANKQGNKVVAASARALIDQLNNVVKPALAVLQQSQNPYAAYTGDITPINKALGGGAPGSGPSGVVLGSGVTGGKGAYTLEQIRAYMDANNGAFPPDLNTVASGITAADLTNLINQYESSPTNKPTGGIDSAINTTSTKTLAQDTFINTFKLIVGDKEGSKSYVPELYKYIVKFWKTGSTIEESINLALRDAKNNNAIPEFTNRFAAIFKLEDMKAAGKIVNIPTVAEYVASEEKLADVLTRSNLGDLANESFISNVLATGKSVSESTDIVLNVFDAIDNAPAEWKAQVAKALPFADRATLAKAILTGPEGVKQLERTVATAGVQAAAGMQGLTLSQQAAGELVSKGQTFATSGARFGQVARLLPEAQKLTSIESGYMPAQAYTQEQAIAATFDQSAAELKKLEDLARREEARYMARSGTIGSKSFASQARGAGLV